MIRQFRASDTDTLIAIWQDANAIAHPFLSESFVAEVAVAMRNIYLPNAETWVLEQDGQPIGFIALIDNEIGGLFIAPARHGKGFGRQLVDHAVALKGPLKVEVFEQNSIGRPFYERCGFARTEKYYHADSGASVIKMTMPTSLT